MSDTTTTLKRTPVVKIGDRARIARREMGASQATFTEMLRPYLPTINEKTYSSWEAGTVPPHEVVVARALAKVTTLPWTWFITEEQPERSGGGDDPRLRYFMSPQSDSNRRPPLYKTDALLDFTKAHTRRDRPTNRRDNRGPKGRAA